MKLRERSERRKRRWITSSDGQKRRGAPAAVQQRSRVKRDRLLKTICLPQGSRKTHKSIILSGIDKASLCCAG